MAEPRDVPLERNPEQEQSEFPPDCSCSDDPLELPIATGPAFDTSIFDDLPLDEDGVLVLPYDFDGSQLPGYDPSS